MEPVVFLVETFYEDGTSERNSIHWSEEGAQKSADFIKSHEGFSDKKIKEVRITDVIVLE